MTHYTKMEILIKLSPDDKFKVWLEVTGKYTAKYAQIILRIQAIEGKYLYEDVGVKDPVSFRLSNTCKEPGTINEALLHFPTRMRFSGLVIERKND